MRDFEACAEGAPSEERAEPRPTGPGLDGAALDSPSNYNRHFLRFDETIRVFEISVRELAEDEGFRRVGFDRGDGWRRLGLGAQIHTRVLDERRDAHPAYRAEVAPGGALPVEDWTAVLTGRLDGCIERSPGQWLIEEIKSTNLTVDGVRPAGYAFERDRRQLLGYCYLWRRLGHGSNVNGALVYVDIETGSELSLDVPFDDEIERESREAGSRAPSRSGATRRSRGSARPTPPSGCPSPHTAPRPIQEKLIDAIRNAVAAGENLIAEAPTGSGKTAAALYPALAEGLASGRQIVFLTSKTLQQKMAVSSLVAMNERAFQTVQVRAKERMCANDRDPLPRGVLPRSPRTTPTKMERSDLLGRLRERLRPPRPRHGVRGGAPRGGLPVRGAAGARVARGRHRRRLQLRLRACGRAAAPDGRRPERGDPRWSTRPTICPDRARQIFSPELLEEDLRSPPEPACAAGGRPVRGHRDLDRGAPGDPARRPPTTCPRGRRSPKSSRPPSGSSTCAWTGKPSSCATSRGSARRGSRSSTIPSWTSTSRCSVSRPSSRCSARTSRCVVERRSGGIRLGLVCLDPARALAPVFRAAHSTILLSATLTPPEASQRVLGLEKDRTSSISLPPPFPAREPQGHDRADRCGRRSRRGEKNYERIAQLLAGMSDAHGGNDLVLFPSYRFLAAVSEHMPRDALAAARPASGSDGTSSDSTCSRRCPRRRPAARCSSRCRAACTPRAWTIRASCCRRSSSCRPRCRRSRSSASCCGGTSTSREEAGFDYAYLQPGHDARRPGGGPADPQRARPGRHRARLRPLPRGAVRQPPPARLVRREPARARDARPGRRDPRVLREVPVKNSYTKIRRCRASRWTAWVRDRKGRVLLVKPRAPAVPRALGPARRILRVEGDDRGVLRPRDARGNGTAVRVGKLLGVYSRPDRDPRGHNVTVVYAATPLGAASRAATTRPKRGGSRRGEIRESSSSRSITGKSSLSSSRGTAGANGRCGPEREGQSPPLRLRFQGRRERASEKALARDRPDRVAVVRAGRRARRRGTGSGRTPAALSADGTISGPVRAMRPSAITSSRKTPSPTSPRGSRSSRPAAAAVGTGLRAGLEAAERERRAKAPSRRAPRRRFPPTRSRDEQVDRATPESGIARRSPAAKKTTSGGSAVSR